jgi:hypothetical protein
MKKKFLVERDILLYSLRYALGRKTVAPTTVIENFKENITKFNNDDIELIIKEIKEQENYGSDLDAKDWKDFLKFLENNLYLFKEYKG